eukprot:3089814-Amphidinium_carterae.3
MGLIIPVNASWMMADNVFEIAAAAGVLPLPALPIEKIRLQAGRHQLLQGPWGEVIQGERVVVNVVDKRSIVNQMLDGLQHQCVFPSMDRVRHIVFLLLQPSEVFIVGGTPWCPSQSNGNLHLSPHQTLTTLFAILWWSKLERVAGHFLDGDHVQGKLQDQDGVLGNPQLFGVNHMELARAYRNHSPEEGPALIKMCCLIINDWLRDI